MTKTRATILGFFVAPIIPSIFFVLSSPGLGGADADITTLFSLSIIGYFYALFTTLIFGFPLFIILKRKNLVFWWSAIASGCIAGVLACFCYAGPAYIINTQNYKALGLWGTAGALAGLLFWLVWQLGRHTLTHHSSGTPNGTR